MPTCPAVPLHKILEQVTKPIFTLAAFLLFGQLHAQIQTAAFSHTAINHLKEEPKNGSINGRVTTTDGQPAAGVSIDLRGTGIGTTTDAGGYFLLRNLKPGGYTLVVSFVGLRTTEQYVVVKENGASTVSLGLEEDARQLNEVVVRAQKSLNERTASIGKISVNPMDMPQSLTVIGQGLIRDQQAQRLGDVIRNVNGVYVTTTRGNVQESFGARGYSLGNNNLFKNGARVNSGVMPEMSSLEKVEVLKGSAAILYGQVAPGGIVNMVTKQPKFTSGGEVSMRAGSYDLYKPAFDFYGPLSGGVAYRINGTYESAGSFRDRVSSERYYVNPSLLFKLGKRTELVAEGDYLSHNFTPDFGIGSLAATKIPDVPRSRFMGTGWQYSKTRQSTANLTIRHQLSDAWKLTAAAGYQYYERDYFAVERIQADSIGDWTRPLGRILTDEHYYSSQANLIGKFNTGNMEHNVLAGLDADRFFTSNNDFTFAPVAGLPAGGYDKINILDPTKYVQRTDLPEATAIRLREAPINRFGAYAQDLLKVSDKFNVLAGIRWSYVQTLGIDSTNLLTKAKTKGQDRSDKAFSPRLGLVYKPFATTSVFVSYANSFNTNTGQDITGNTIKPSIIDQYEIGVKNEFLNGLLSANVTAYRIINNNLAQTAPFLQDGITPNNNSNIKMLSGETTSDGIEIDLAAHPASGLDITAGYSYNYMRFTQTDTTQGAFKEGERLVNNPAHTANGSIFYTVLNGKLQGFKAGITAVYIGDRFGGWNTDVVKQAGKPFTYRSRIFPVDGFATIDLTAGYTYKKISLLAKLSNLTNTFNYYVHENYSINPIPPRQLVATVAYKF